MDLNMPQVTGIQATRLIRERFPAVRVLALTTYDADEWVLDAVRAGAAGYLLKDTPRDELIGAIEGTVAGRTFVDPDVAGKLFIQLAGRTVMHDTTLARGLSNKEIAQQLYLSGGTVRNYLSQVFAKLDVADRAQAAVIALRHGLAE